MKVLSTALILAVVGVSSSAKAANAAKGDDVAASVKLGSPVDQLLDVFSGMYAHLFPMREIIYEACDQKSLTVFTFTEEPWSRGRITQIWIRKAEDKSVCRDETGALPDVKNEAITARGLRLDDPESKVSALYGKPNKINQGAHGEKVLIYELKPSGAKVEHIKLAVTIIGAKVNGFSLFGDMPGVKKPE